ncbi:MAG: hypothetical protein KDC53_14505 [Saprospiraceae bacterium]|nr:hypothetical protein [Saprospiraceae bacterium]
MKTILSIVLVSLMWVKGWSQYTILPKPIGEESIVYETERLFHLRAHSNGFSLGYAVGDIETWYKTKYYFFDIGSLKNAKEYSQNFRFFTPSLGPTPSRAFIYGKINRLYALRAGVGTKKYFSERARRKSVIVGMHYEYGFTLGVLKPYYLKLKNTEGRITEVKYTGDNADLFLDETNIYGGAEFRYGLDEIKLKPGFHGQFGANFTWGNQDNLVKALEVGVMADLFLSKVPLMLTEVNKPYFVNVYLTLQLGKRS